MNVVQNMQNPNAQPKIDGILEHLKIIPFSNPSVLLQKKPAVHMALSRLHPSNPVKTNPLTITSEVAPIIQSLRVEQRIDERDQEPNFSSKMMKWIDSLSGKVSNLSTGGGHHSNLWLVKRTELQKRNKKKLFSPADQNKMQQMMMEAMQTDKPQKGVDMQQMMGAKMQKKIQESIQYHSGAPYMSFGVLSDSSISSIQIPQAQSIKRSMLKRFAGKAKNGILYEVMFGSDATELYMSAMTYGMMQKATTKYFGSPEEVSKFFRSPVGKKMLARFRIGKPLPAYLGYEESDGYFPSQSFWQRNMMMLIILGGIAIVLAILYCCWKEAYYYLFCCFMCPKASIVSNCFPKKDADYIDPKKEAQKYGAKIGEVKPGKSKANVNGIPAYYFSASKHNANAQEGAAPKTVTAGQVSAATVTTTPPAAGGDIWASGDFQFPDVVPQSEGAAAPAPQGDAPIQITVTEPATRDIPTEDAGPLKEL